jgi:hypothetical protein
MSKRFEYVDYDGPAAAKSGKIRKLFCAVEHALQEELPDSRPKSLALTKLEESFMWAGKAIRDWQLSQPKNEERTCECGATIPGHGGAQCDKCALFNERSDIQVCPGCGKPQASPWPCETCETREAVERDKQALESGVCLRCGEDIEPDLILPTNDRLCGYCNHVTDKDD